MSTLMQMRLKMLYGVCEKFSIHATPMFLVTERLKNLILLNGLQQPRILPLALVSR